MKLQESHKVNPQDYFLQNGVDEYGNPIYNLANEVVTDYAPAKAIRKKVHDGILDTVFQANKIQLYWNSNLIAEAQLEVQVETSPSIWEGQVFSFQDANVKKIDWDDSHPDWNINDVHEQGSTVVHNNATWICKTDNGPSSPIEPGIDAETGTYWRQLDPIAPYFRGNEIKDIPTLGITNAVIGLDVHSGWHLDKMSFYADVPGFNTRIRWQCRVKDSAVAWVDNTDPENPIFHKGLSFNTKDYQGTVNPGNMDDPEPGWTIRWWTFEPNGKQIDAADARTSRERYKQGVGLVVDPYLSVDEQATYYDVLCDGYTLRIYEGDQEVADIATLLIGGTDYGGIDDRLVVSAGTYRLTYDTARSVIIVENTPTRIGIRIKGSWTTDAQVPLTNSVNVEYSLFIYPDQVFIDVVWGTSGNITIDNSILNGIIGFDPSSTNLTNEDSYYESAGSEINGSGEQTTADYIGIFADEVRIMITNTYKSYSTGYSQYLDSSGAIAHIRWNNTTLASGTYRMQGVVTFDSATREGSLRIYSETDRLAIGDQYKDREIDLTEGGSRIFDDASTEYLEIGQAVLSGSPLTLAGWGKPDANQDGYIVSIADKDDPDERIGIKMDTLAAPDYYCRLQVRDGVEIILADTSNLLTMNAWNHFVGTKADATTHESFLNGDIANKGTDSTSCSPINFDTTSIGRTGDSTPTNYWSGKIAHVAIWNVVLTDAEIVRLAAGALPTEIRPEALVAYWPLIDDDNDIIGGYNMTPYNSPTWSTTDYPDVWKPNKGKWEIQNILPATIDESGFQSDGAFHITPVSPRVKPTTDNDDLKTAPDVDAVGGIAEDLDLAVLLNEESGNSIIDHSGNSRTGTNSNGTWNFPGPYMAFDGGDYISHGDVLDYQANLSFTIITRLRVSSSEDADANLLSKMLNTGDFTGWAIRWLNTNSNFQFIIRKNASEYLQAITDEAKFLPVKDKWYTVAVTYDGTATLAGTNIYVNGTLTSQRSSSDDFLDAADDCTSAAVLTVAGRDANADAYMDMDFYYIFGRELSAAEIRFVSNNPYWMFGDAGKVKLTMDRTRIRPNIVIDDHPFYYGPRDNPVDTLLNHLKMDDNAADNVLKAEVGSDGSWHVVSTDAARNTDNDSVQADNFRGRALDTKNLYHPALEAGVDTAHNNAFYLKGSILFKSKIFFAYNTGTSHRQVTVWVDSSNYIILAYPESQDRLNWQGHIGGSSVYINGPTYTQNFPLQHEQTILLSWDWSKDLFLYAIDGKVIGMGRHTGTPGSGEPTGIYFARQGTTANNISDMVLDDIKTFSEMIVPFGGHFVGNGEVDTSAAHADILTFVECNQTSGQAMDIGSGNVTITNATRTTGVDGESNSAYLVDNDNEKIYFPTSGNISIAKGSISFWYRATGFNPMTDTNFRHLGFTNRSGIVTGDVVAGFNTTGNTFVFGIVDNAGTPVEHNVQFNDLGIQQNDWHHYRLIWDDANLVDGTYHLALFLDGVHRTPYASQNGTSSWDTNRPTLPTNFYLMSWESADSLSGMGEMDKFFITDDPYTPEIWTAFGKPLHQPLIIEG